MNITSNKHPSANTGDLKFILNYVRLAFRCVLLLMALGVYVYNLITTGSANLFGDSLHEPVVLTMIWAIFVTEMILRFFPSRFENMGCQKQFAVNFRPSGKSAEKNHQAPGVIGVALAWIALNSVIGLLFAFDVMGSDELVIISLVFSVCDVICILFFCPFQTWFMKNRCCSDCRIYNWDYAMMFTPLVFIPNLYAWSLLGISLLLLVRWEITLRRFPERFAVNTNACLSCAACTEKLCHHKKQLRHFREKNLSFEKSRRKSK